MLNNTKTFFLMLLLTLLLIFMGGLLGGRGGMYTAFVIAAAMNFISYWFSDKIVLAMYRAKPVSREEMPDLYRTIERLTQISGLPMPKLYMIPDSAPNAFATGRNPRHAAVAVTAGIVNLLNNDELAGVIAHELSHVKNRDTLISTVAATLAGAIMIIADIARWGAMFGGLGGRNNDERGGENIAGLLIGIIVAPIAATLIQMAISRSREYMADSTGARMVGNPYSLANALRKLHQGVKTGTLAANKATAHMFIVNPLRRQSIFSLFSTHPPVEERIKRLEGMIL